MVKIKKEQIILASIIAAIVITAGTLTYVILTQTEAKFGYSLLDRIEYTYDSEAEITIKKGDLEIERFYPMNLLQNETRAVATSLIPA